MENHMLLYYIGQNIIFPDIFPEMDIEIEGFNDDQGEAGADEIVVEDINEQIIPEVEEHQMVEVIIRHLRFHKPKIEESQ